MKTKWVNPYKVLTAYSTQRCHRTNAQYMLAIGGGICWEGGGWRKEMEPNEGLKLARYIEGQWIHWGLRQFF